MNKLKIPYLPALDVLDMSSVDFLMESKSYRDYINVVNWKEQYPYKPIAVFDIARSDVYMYIRFFSRGYSLKAVYGEDGSPVHEDSCVEFFMKKEGENEYMNFEFNCIGTCDAARRQSRDVKKPLAPYEYSGIRRYTLVEGKPLEAKPFDERKRVYAWELIVTIPLKLMGLDAKNLPEKILGNFYKCADKTENPHYLSWNPIATPKPDFHRTEFFGELYF
ncbi:MAG: hypothetical protein LBF62_14770 [Tannerellaceae bacterium]|jgi:hypothetical protein|nr:hypothetical protein [Tannerellaceae bacterium]